MFVGQLNNLKHVLTEEKSLNNTRILDLHSSEVFKISKVNVFCPVLTFSAGGFLLTLRLPGSGADTGVYERGGRGRVGVIHFIKSDLTLSLDED